MADESAEIPQTTKPLKDQPQKTMFDRWQENAVTKPRNIQEEVTREFMQSSMINQESLRSELSEKEVQQKITEEYSKVLHDHNSLENQRKFNDVMAVYFTNPDIEVIIKGFDANGELIQNPNLKPSSIVVDSEGRTGATDENRRMRQKFLNGERLPEFFLMDGVLTRVSNSYKINVSTKNITRTEKLITDARPIDSRAIDLSKLEKYSKWSLQKILDKPLSNNNEIQDQPMQPTDYEILKGYLTAIEKRELEQV